VNPGSAATEYMPVMFPPGRARLLTIPVATGSSLTRITIGMYCVAARAAAADGGSGAKMTATFKRTNSSAIRGRRAALPPAERHTNEPADRPARVIELQAGPAPVHRPQHLANEMPM